MKTPKKRRYGWWAFTAGLAMSAALLASAAAGSGGAKAVELLPLEPREQRFRITEGKAAGTEADLVMEAAPDASRARWRLSLTGFNELYLQQMPDGGIGISEIVINTSDQRIVFAEPVPLLPARMAAGEVQRMRTTAYIYDTDTGRQIHRGPVAHQLTALGFTRFDLPSGTVNGAEVELKQRIDLRLANVDLGLRVGFAPGQGMVRRRMELTVEKLGLFRDTSVTVSELAEPPQARSAALATALVPKS